MVYIETLKQIAALGAIENAIKISSSELAELLTSSPQTAARYLQALEQNNLLERHTTNRGQWIKLTPDGVQRLEQEYLFYQQLFNVKTPTKITGTVITGLGEGQYYIANKGYREQIIQKLGFVPYPGTLNLKLDSENVRLRRNLNEKKAIKIDGFTNENRTFGGGKCFPILIENIKGAIIQPERTHYPLDIIEIIAPVNLRESLKLDDGSIIEINIQ